MLLVAQINEKGQKQSLVEGRAYFLQGSED